MSEQIPAPGEAPTTPAPTTSALTTPAPTVAPASVTPVPAASGGWAPLVELLQAVGLSKGIAALIVLVLTTLGFVSNNRLDALVSTIERVEAQIRQMPTKSDLLIRDERFNALDRRLERLEARSEKTLALSPHTKP